MWAREELNLRPLPCQGGAASSRLLAQHHAAPQRLATAQRRNRIGSCEVERGVPWRTLWQIAGMSMGTHLVVLGVGQATSAGPNPPPHPTTRAAAPSGTAANALAR